MGTALPGSPNELQFNVINIALGNAGGQEASLDTMTAAAVGSSTITNQPDALSDWWNYNHWGEIWGTDDGAGHELYLPNKGASPALPDGAASNFYTPSKNETVAKVRNVDNSDISSGDYTFTMWRRTKNTALSWGTAISQIEEYASETFVMDNDTYDYKIEMSG